MTSKIFTGGAIIPYGPLLPLPTTTPDGSLFYKTVDSVEGSAGLYFFGLLPDTNPGFGEQPGLGWVRSISTQIGADTLGGLPSSAYQQVNAELSALINQGTTGFYVKTGAGTSASRTLVAGSSRLSITNPSGVSGNPILDVSEVNLSLANIGGTLPVSKGGTGATSAAAGAIVYSTASTYGLSGVGAVGQVLLSGGTGAPTWASQSTLTVGSATSATTATNATNATKLATARTISITGDGTWSTTFDGSVNVSSAFTLAQVATAGTFGSASLIPVITVDNKGRVTGVSTSSVTASTANSLSTARNISATGDASWSVSFNGSQNASSDLILTTVNANAGTFGSSTLIPQFTVDAKGRVTSVTQVPITTAAIADTANQLTNTRTISATGDAAWSVSFNGSANVSGTLTLTSVNSNVGSFGSASAIPVITVDAKGRITAVSTQTSIAANTANTATTATTATNATNATTANQLTNTRTISATGDAAWSVSFNGSANVSGTLTLTSVNSNVGSFGSASAIPVITVDAKGRITAVSTQTSIAANTANTATTATTATNVAITTSTASSEFKIPFANTTVSTTGNYGLLQDSTATFTYNPSTNTLTVGTVSGALDGSAAQTKQSVTFNNAGTGAASGTTFNGSTARTISYNTIGAPSTSGTNATGTWDISVTGNADTVTNGVYTTGNQTIDGVKTFSSQIRMASGSATSPSIAFSADGSTDTGLYWGGEGYTFFTNNGIKSGEIQPGGNLVMVGNVTAFSDANLKEDLKVIPNALEKVCKLTGYTYSRIDTGRRDTGLIAQEVKEVLPEAVIHGEHLSLAYGNMVGLLVEAIKELKAEIEVLKGNK